MPKNVRFRQVKTLFWGATLFLGFVLAYAVYSLFLPFLLGFLLALFLMPGVERFEKQGLSRTQSIFLVFSFSGACFLLLLMYLLPTVFMEIQDLNENKDYYVQSATKKYNQFKGSIEKRYPKSVPWKDLENTIQNPGFFSKSRLLDLPGMLGSGLEFLFGILFLPPLFAFFFLKDGPDFKKTILRLVPNRYFELVSQLLHNINLQVIAFLRGQTLDSLINGALYATALSWIGLPYALLVGSFSGLANAVPVIGPSFSCLIAVTIAVLSQSANPFLIVGVYAMIHLTDVMFIYPRTVGHSLSLHEGVVIVGVIVGGHVGGVLGMLLVVPLLGIALRSLRITYMTLKGYRIL